MTTNNTTLGSLDWLVIVLYGLGMLIIGFYFSRKNKSTEDYMLGGRKMSFWKVGLSMFATLFSAVTYLSLPGEIVRHGPMILCMLAAFPFIYVIVSRFFIPFIMKLKVSSAYELLESRLDKKNRYLASVYFLIMRLVWMSVIIYMCSEKIIVPILQLSENMALWVSILMGVITIVYTSIGGIRGVVVTDVIQSFILFGGGILTMILIVNALGGPSHLIPSQWPEGWGEWVFFDTGVRVSFLTAFTSAFCWYIFTAGSDQMAVQRYLATGDKKSARKMYLIFMLSLTVITLMLAGIGFSVMAYFKSNPMLLPPDTSVAGAADQLFPRFIVTGIPSGLSGLILAGLLAAAMSSLSSGINSSCLVIINDFILPYYTISSEKKRLRLAWITSLIIGLVVVILSLIIGNIKGNLLELTFKTINSLVGPLFVPFFMAMFISWVKPTPVFIGTIFSGLVAILISFSNELFSINISFLWIIPGSFIAGAVMSMALSALTLVKAPAKSSQK